MAATRARRLGRDRCAVSCQRQRTRGVIRPPLAKVFCPSRSESGSLPTLISTLPKSSAFFARRVASHPERPHRALHRDGRLRGDRGGDAGGRRRQFGVGHDFGDETDLVRPLRRNPLVRAHQGDAHDLVERHLLQHVHRLEARRHAVRDVRVEERGRLGGDDELDLAEHVERAAAGHPVDRGDHRLPQVVRSSVRCSRRGRRNATASRSTPSRSALALAGRLGVVLPVPHRLLAVDAGAERLGRRHP